MFDYKVVNAKEKDLEVLINIKLLTMIDNETDKALSNEDKGKVSSNIFKSIKSALDNYKLIYIDKTIIGAYAVLPYEDGQIIDEIFLYKEYRRKGIGTDIINKIKKEYNNVYIWVYKKNKQAIELFERLGFYPISNGRTMIMKCNTVYFNIKDKIEGIRLGYRDKDGNKFLNFGKDFKERFYLQNPKQLLESKIGTCFEQVELERDLITKLDVDLRTYFIYYPDEEFDLAHVFLIYKDKKKYYWLENSWVKYRGLHIYDTKQDLFNDVLKKFVETIPHGDFKKVRLYLYEKPRFGINYVKFFSHCINGKSMKNK